MSLHTYTVDGRALSLHFLHHIIYTVALGRVSGVVVVVEQFCVGVGLTCILEHLHYKLIAAEVHHLCLAVRTWSFLHPWHLA